MSSNTSLITSDKLTVELTTDEVVINSILNDSDIYQMANGSSESTPINESYREELISKGFKFLSIVINGTLIGLISFRELSKITTEVHIHVLPESHKKGYGKQAVYTGMRWFSRTHACKTLITYVPSNCFHVLKFMKDNDFTACGLIPEAIIYNNELVSLYIFNRGL